MLFINNNHYSVSFKRHTKNQNTFRDREMFNMERDKVHNGCTGYDIDDVPINIGRNPWIYQEKIDGDYFLRNTQCHSQDYDTSEIIIGGGLDWFEEEEKKASKANTKIVPLDDDNLENKLKNACILEGKNGPEFSQALYDYLKAARDGNEITNYPISTGKLIVIGKASKLKHSDGTEYVNYNMIDSGIRWSNKLITCKNSELKQILNSFIAKDKFGDEIFLKDAADYLHRINKTVSPQKVEKAMKKSVVYDKDGYFYFNKYIARDSL